MLAEVKQLLGELISLRMLVEATLFPKKRSTSLKRLTHAGRLDMPGQRGVRLAGALPREGIKVVLAGQPNVAELVCNALAGAELAIVTPIPGTTRQGHEASSRSTVCRCT